MTAGESALAQRATTASQAAFAERAHPRASASALRVIGALRTAFAEQQRMLRCQRALVSVLPSSRNRNSVAFGESCR